jgi:hypothetical protein
LSAGRAALESASETLALLNRVHGDLGGRFQQLIWCASVAGQEEIAPEVQDRPKVGDVAQLVRVPDCRK